MSAEETLKTAEDYWAKYSHKGAYYRIITEANFKDSIRKCQSDTALTVLTQYKESQKEKDQKVYSLLSDCLEYIRKSPSGRKTTESYDIIERAKQIHPFL